jgi:hypothetical protein
LTQTEQDPPAVAATPPPWAGGDIVATVLALLEAAALTTAMRRVASWNPHLHIYAAADRMWMRPESGDQGDWRTDSSKQAADLRLAVLVAEATISHRLAEDGYLSARQLSVDLRDAAAWLASGAQLGA